MAKKTTKKEGNKEATKQKMLKLRIVLWVTKPQMRNRSTKFAIETEEKTIVEFLRLTNLLHL